MPTTLESSRPDSSIEDEMELSHEVRYVEPMFEVFSIQIRNFFGDLYGTITVRDSCGTQYLYQTEREEYQSIRPGNTAFLLTGPARGITALDDVAFHVDLMDKESDKPLLRAGLMEWSPGFHRHNMYNKPTYEDIYDYDEDGGACCLDPHDDGEVSVRVNYMVSKDAVEATLEVTLIIGDGEEDSAHVYGMITARNSNFPDESLLFQKEWNERVDVKAGQPIPLSRSVVAIPFNSSLIVRADLFDYDDANVIVKDSVQLPAKLSGTSEERMYGQRGEIRVNVTFRDDI
ncbi:hypothetical protein HHK36_019065 [Tetracentron sinense]|uniref:DUF6598 domain-containing protein n=1 Tax=Tetracentron sinense TaxID=13715 RepID=A0A834YTA5_TETSI|nr:hypothetical protein HHK36_019065 [Tetracentron sinense]